ncbi:MAG: hypothetical protein DI551_11170 [Micavibrio aeruginosavorus]|uniref:Methyltransferase type 11 domain-containing protein n=1 Tax=Micavibrio aeruginosavorus TaxID=349221 RepID=A0A2W5MRR9_9BACT|nr:MAG: hypothetical protein DI551_11170 [Micavibrio aeruginosavorus]
MAGRLLPAPDWIQRRLKRRRPHRLLAIETHEKVESRVSMSIGNKVFSVFHRLSKKFSREGLYTWLEEQCSELNARADHREYKILNVGSGGEVFRHLRAIKNANLIQTDIDPDRKPDIVADVCNMHMFEDNSIDCVFMVEVLEHVKTPQKGIDEVYRVLKPGGKLYLSTPFIFPLHDEPYDFYRYTKYGLTHMLAAFHPVSMKERNDYYSSILVLFARGIINTDRMQRYVGLFFFIYILIQYPIFWLFSKIATNTKATTGYTVTAVK